MREVLPRRWRRPTGVVAAAAVIGGVACYPFEATSVSQTDVVITVHDSTKNFGAVQTYVLLDTVVHVIADSDSYIDLSRQFDDVILQTVDANLQALGWTVEANPAVNPPDVTVAVAATGSESTYIYYDWWYYWGWYPYWGWGCVTCYPYYGYPVVVEYETGSLVLQMVESRTDPDSVPVVWAGVLRGLLGTAASTTQQRVTQGINQAFNQSPYLEGN